MLLVLLRFAIVPLRNSSAIGVKTKCAIRRSVTTLGRVISMGLWQHIFVSVKLDSLGRIVNSVGHQVAD